MTKIKNFIKSFKDGIDRGIGERGQTLSGGQRQRIGLARIFLQKPSVILLDEATNALDYATEVEVYRNIKTLSPGRIVVVVAHRLSAIKDFEQIIMMKEGRIVESGTHEELMLKRQFYYNLYSVQRESEKSIA